MALKGTRTYVGFGFGPIQAGLFLYEAHASGAFDRLVVACRRPEVIAAVRRAGGFALNIAHHDRVERATVGPVEIENLKVAADRERLVAAVAAADEIGVAVSSVKDYVSAGAGSLHRVLAEGLRRKAARGGPRAVVYAAENHNAAAHILASQVLAHVPEGERERVRARVRFLDTVIGKMSGVVAGAAVRAQGLAPVTPEDPRAFLVESFNHILISKVSFTGPPFKRGLEVFEEKAALFPFEEAKLHGHNATHALAAYVGAVRGLQRMADLRESPGMLPFLRAAFVEESGRALCRKHAGADPLFTAEGYRRYADDLLARMTNPHLQDTVRRVGRDPARKLGWDDRLVGTARLALREGVTPRRYALGVAAALALMEGSKEARLAQLWPGVPEGSEKRAVSRLVREARRRLERWREAGFPELERFLEAP